MTAGTKYAAMTSASRAIGALEPCACSTSRMICASAVSAPTLVALNVNEPVVFIVAPITSSYRMELGFLLIASIVGFVIPLSGEISLILGFALLGFFVFYLWKASRAGKLQPDLVGVAARIGGLPARARRLLVAGMLVFAAAVIVASAEPFANSLITTGTQLGLNKFLLVQWVAPLASEAPEFIVAILFAVHGKGSDAIGTLISSKVNQWTLLVGSLPLAYLAGGGDGAAAGPAAGRGVPADRYPGAARIARLSHAASVGED